jgi:hypothetical protein
MNFSKEFSLYDLMIGLFDRIDGREKVNVKMSINKTNWGRFKDPLGNALLQYYRGEIDEEQVLTVDPQDKARAYFFIGAKKEMEGQWKEAKKWYKMAAEQDTDDFERLLALSRLGTFSFKFTNKKFGRSESYRSSDSLISQNGQKKYPVSNLFDDSLETAWAYNEEQSHEDNYLTVEFPREYWVSVFSIANGYSKSKKLFLENNRVKVFQVSFSDGTSRSIEIQDKMGLQKIEINKKTSFVKFVIKETYAGSKYHDTCISELTVH